MEGKGSDEGNIGDKKNVSNSPRYQNELMFPFDDQSPHSSPRDKSNPAIDDKLVPDQKANNLSPRDGATASLTQDSPSNSPRSNKFFPGPQEFLTQSSPPQFVSLKEIMKAADGVKNMSLAHEIAVNNDFRFQKTELPANSIEKKVHDTMHNAFWDVLESQLKEDPPDYSHALILLEEIKQNLLDLLLPHNHPTHAQIEEVLDLKLIEQQADHGVLDIQYYGEFIIYIMSKLCAPIRDEEIEKLKEIKEIVPLFRGIFATLDLMKLDMVNFTIQQIRPYLQTQSIEYERKKFIELLKQQEEHNQDGLLYTKAWLHRAGEIVCKEAKASASSKPRNIDTSSSNITAPKQSKMAASENGESSTKQPKVREIVSPPGVSPASILNTAYMELLEWPEEYVFPETLLMDQHRFIDLSDKVKWLGLMSSLLMVIYNTVGSPISNVRSFKEKLKNDIAIIISGIKFEDVKSVMPNVGDHVVKEVQLFLKDHGYNPLTDETVNVLKGLIESVASPSQPVHKCLRERLLAHIRKLLSIPGSEEIQVPGGFAAMAEEFSHVYGQFLRLITYNRAVFGTFYADIIATFLHEKVEQLKCEEK